MSVMFPENKTFKMKFISMSSPENDLQVTIRMPSSLKNEIDAFVLDKDITSMEFIRRAVREKLAREHDLPIDAVSLTPDKFKRLLIHAIQTDAEVQAELRALKQ